MNGHGGSPTGASLTTLTGWLLDQALGDSALAAIVSGAAHRMRDAGLPIARGFFAFSVLHPQYDAVSVVWQRGIETVTTNFPHVPGGQSEQYRRSPYYLMREQGLERLRCRLEGPPGEPSFPVLGELRAQGMTDYLAFTVRFGGDNDGVMNSSWATDRLGGFTESELAGLDRINWHLAATCKVAVQRQLMRNLVATYLGKDAGGRVLSGQIKLGDGQAIEAVIWYADLRGSTRLADTLPRQEFIDTLNSFYAAAGGAVEAAGGEILSLIGDALLAIFPVPSSGETLAAPCERAFAAAVDARQRLAEINGGRVARGLSVLDFGVSLHIGEVLYGNVGVADRLSFSVFGAAVNEVVRIDELTKELGEPVLASDRFVQGSGRSWRAAGAHSLRGIERRMAVFAP